MEGNAERVALSVMNSIENPILMEDILPSVQDLQSVFGVAANGLGKRKMPFGEDDD
jgi:hypothetical protein